MGQRYYQQGKGSVQRLERRIMNTYAEDYCKLAARKVDEATQARLNNDEDLANTLLREASRLYMDAGEFGEAQTCRMLIVTE